MSNGCASDEGCCYVRLILQGFRIDVDKRDVSLHAEVAEIAVRISMPMLRGIRQ